jgi:hypothetical protein
MQTFFPHNDKTKIAGQSFGNHGGDWEHVTVRSTLQGEMLSMYFAAHGSDEGTWEAATSVHFDARGGTDRPIVFVAKGGHGAYPEESSWSRKEGPEKAFSANDETNSQGSKWAPSAIIVTGGASASETTVVSTIPDDPVAADRASQLPATFTREEKATTTLPLKVVADVIIQASPWVNWDCFWGRGTFSMPQDDKFAGQEKAGKNPTSPQRQGWYNKVEGPSFVRARGDVPTNDAP